MILDHCYAIQNDVRALKRPRVGAVKVTGQLALGLIPTIAPYVVTDVIVALRASDLNLELQIHEGKTETLIAQLRSGAIDAAVVALPIPLLGFILIPFLTIIFCWLDRSAV